MPDEHVTPDKTPEFQEWVDWYGRSNGKALNIVKSIAGWTDICGFGNALAQSEWQLEKLLDAGVFSALSSVYSLMGTPFQIGVPPTPSERVLVINDGIARTLDVDGMQYTDRGLLTFFVRDTLMKHFMAERNLVGMNLGLRTVLAGGQRCQYTPPSMTGHSMLSYTNEPSAMGKEILKQTFVYNPIEFQMNTAFALAYTLDAMGSKKGIIPNRVYIEQRWLDLFNEAHPGFFRQSDGALELNYRDYTPITINTDDRLEIDAKGRKAIVHRVSRMTVHEEFEGEETVFPMNEHDLKQNSPGS